MIDQDVLRELIADRPLSFVRNLETYMSEAESFMKLLESDFSELSPESSILEIGSGIGLLSIYIASRGFHVTSVEPESSGFSQMLEMRQILLRAWVGTRPTVEWHRSLNASELDTKLYDFAFSINVLEHVPEWPTLISRSLQLLKKQSALRVVFPNYVWPYEPHFNMPTVFSKKLSLRIQRRRVERADMDSPLQFWNDLSWISGGKLRRESHRMGFRTSFQRAAFNSYLMRLSGDPIFLERKGLKQSAALRRLSLILTAISKIIPRSALPVIDCRIRSGESID